MTVKGDLLDAKAAANRGFSGLHGWMRKAEAVWNENAESGKMTLLGRWNYHNELGAQFPIAPLRVVYSRSGTLQASAVVRDRHHVVDFSLYHAACATIPECRYLTALFNSEVARRRVEGQQSRGAWGARDFAKIMFTLPIPRFDPKNTLHAELAEAAREAEEIAATVPLSESVKFQRARKLVRDALTEAGIAPRIDALVARLLDEPVRRS
ncbi:MAG: hypothetical protein WD036_00555 [Bauldia sp.]